MKKRILVVLDGIGDLPTPELNNQTPLEYAKTTNLDFLALHGKTGLSQPLKQKVAPESDVAIMSLLGYEPLEYYTGRGPIEAVGFGLKFKDGDLMLRTNFGTLIDKKIADRRAGRTLTTEEAQILAQAINEKVKLDYIFEFKATSQHRGVLIIRGDFSDNISNVDPGYKRESYYSTTQKEMGLKKCRPLDGKNKSKLTADIVNDFVKQTYKVLNNHPINEERRRKYLLPANILLLRDAGITIPDLPPKKDWAAVVGMPLEIGLAKLSNMHIIKVDYPELKTTDVYKNLYDCLNAEIETAKKAIKQGFFNTYFIHFKETDVPGHDNKPKDKVKMIEILDKEFFSFIRKYDCSLVVTGDHSTPCILKGHSSDPVPVLIYGQDMEMDNKTRFTEKDCKEGSLGKLYAKDLLIQADF